MTEETSREPAESREVPTEIRQRRDTWFRQYQKWIAIHYIFGIAAVVYSTIAAGIANVNLPVWQIPLSELSPILSIIAAISAALITLLKPANRAGASIRTWNLLEAAVRRYSLTTQYTLDNALDALEQGERILRGADADQGP